MFKEFISLTPLHKANFNNKTFSNQPFPKHPQHSFQVKGFNLIKTPWQRQLVPWMGDGFAVDVLMDEVEVVQMEEGVWTGDHDGQIGEGVWKDEDVLKDEGV